MADEFSTPADGATSTAPPAEATPASATPPATPGGPAPGATPQVPEGYVPSYRLREQREAILRESQTAYEKKEADYKAQIEKIQSQVHALVGVQPSQNTEADSIKQQFFTLFPWAKKLEDRFGDFESLVAESGNIKAQNEHYWSTYGQQTMARVYEQASTALGVPLTDAGKRQLHASFTGFVQSSPELQARYASDPTIVEDFMRDFTSNFIDPARRAASATVAGRAAGAIPQDTPGGVPRTSPVPAPKNLDERADAAWALYNQKKV